MRQPLIQRPGQGGRPGARASAATALGRRLSARVTVAVALGTLALPLAGCGLAAKRGSDAVRLTVTRDLGSMRVGSLVLAQVPPSETLLGLLQRIFPVRTAGSSVSAINGVSAPPGKRWSLWVNGSAASIGPVKQRTAVHPGDHVWWDLEPNGAASAIPAVVGSFPEPFIHGVGGKRLPVTLECAPDTSAACDRAAAALTAIGVPAARQLAGTGSGTDSLGIVVGTWRDLQGEIAGVLVAHGPANSGIYAHFAGRGGQTLELLDSSGRVVRRLGAGSGLVAATASSGTQPIWMVTGTDAVGVSAAASALTPGRLRDHLAVAVHGTTYLPVPRP